MDWILGFELAKAALQAILNIVLFKRSIVGGVVVFTALSMSALFETVPPGYFQTRQSPFTGAVTVKLSPGLWPQFYGEVTTWPRAQTLEFGFDPSSSEPDQRIVVRFSDGTRALVSGSVRVTLPSCPREAVELVSKHAYGTYEQLERQFVLPTVRNALRDSASRMSSRESYSNRYSELADKTRVQLEGKGGAGSGLRALGLSLAHFEIRQVDYGPNVEATIRANRHLEAALASAELAIRVSSWPNR